MMLAAGEGGLQCQQAGHEARDDDKCPSHEASFWSANTRTPSESSSRCASEASDDLSEAESTPPSSLQQTRISRNSTAELTSGVPDLLERMNEASDEVNRLERELATADARYRRRILRYEDIYRGMRAEYGSTFDKHKPLCKDPRSLEVLRTQLGSSIVEDLVRCFQLLERHQDFMAKEHEHMDRLSAKARAAKKVYTATMYNLERISNDVHHMRSMR